MAIIHYCTRCDYNTYDGEKDGVLFFETERHGLLCEFCREELLEHASDEINF